MNICWVFVWSWYEQSDVLKHVYSSVLQAVVKAVVMQDFRDWVWVRVRIAKKRSSTFIIFYVRFIIIYLDIYLKQFYPNITNEQTG